MSGVSAPLSSAGSATEGWRSPVSRTFSVDFCALPRLPSTLAGRPRPFTLSLSLGRTLLSPPALSLSLSLSLSPPRGVYPISQLRATRVLRSRGAPRKVFQPFSFGTATAQNPPEQIKGVPHSADPSPSFVPCTHRAFLAAIGFQSCSSLQNLNFTIFTKPKPLSFVFFSF